MANFLSALLVLSASIFSTYASPLSFSTRENSGVTPLTSEQVSAFKPFTFYASSAYCQPTTTINWTCGTTCEQNAGFIPTDSGGDGTDTQFWFVGFDTALNSVIVAHEGTNASSLVAWLTDFEFAMDNLDPNLFPGVPTSVLVHSGFAAAHARAAPEVLSAVNKTLSEHPGASVSITGHSLGGALALLESLFLPLHLPAETNFKTVTYGMPRVGNKAFADYVDAHVTSQSGGTGLTHINNKKDIVPILPLRTMGFQHPSAEVHIQASEEWDACSGQENPSKLCTDGDVPNILEADIPDHDGPYDGVIIGC